MPRGGVSWDLGGGRGLGREHAQGGPGCWVWTCLVQGQGGRM